MKKFLGLVLAMMLTASMAFAAEKKDSKTSPKKSEKKVSAPAQADDKAGTWSVQFQGDLNFNLTEQGSIPITFAGAGFGFELAALYNVNKNFSIGLLSGIHAVDIQDPPPGMSASWSYAPTEIFAQYSFDGNIRPYLTFGMGLAINQLTLDPDGIDFNMTIATESVLIVSPGVGLAFDLNETTDLFFQSRIDLISTSDDWNTSFWEGSAFIPFQVGLNFSNL